MGVPLSAAAYTALEPTLWSLMNQQQTSTRRSRDKDANDAEEDDAESDMFTAVLAHFDKAGAGSESKSLALEFIKRTILVQTDAAYQDQFMIPDEVPKDSPIGKWTLQSVPKYLWQLQDRQPAISEVSSPKFGWGLSAEILEFLSACFGVGTRNSLFSPSCSCWRTRRMLQKACSRLRRSVQAWQLRSPRFSVA